MLNRKWICTAVLFALTCAQSEAYAQFSGLFRSAPSVKEVSTQQLRRLLSSQADAEDAAKRNGQTSPTPKFVVVDVRSPEEYGVSMIPGAITKQQYNQNRRVYKGRTVIAYCTIGGRSAKYAQQLAANGVKVLNFKESIIGWCNQRYPLVTPKGDSTKRVHTFSSRYQVPAEYEQVTR